MLNHCGSQGLPKRLEAFTVLISNNKDSLLSMKNHRCAAIVALSLLGTLHLSPAAEPEKKPAAGSETKPGPGAAKKPEAGAEKKPAAAAEITEFSQAFAGIPREVMQDLRKGSRGFDEAASKASEQIKKNLAKKTAEFKISVAKVEPFKRGDSSETSYRIFGMTEKIREGSTPFNAIVMAMVDESEKEKVLKLKKPDRIVVTGTIIGGSVTGPMPTLHIDLTDAKLK